MKNHILRRVVFMKTINAVFKEFLDEQRQRLKPRTYEDYEEVINVFVEYLNSYLSASGKKRLRTF